MSQALQKSMLLRGSAVASQLLFGMTIRCAL